MEPTNDYIVERPYYPAYFVARLVNTIIGIIEFIIAVRLVLELFGASAASAFVAWVYSVSASLIGPFNGAFASLNLGNGSVLDINAILAMVAYAIIGWILIEVISALFVSTTRTNYR
jgi:hypothetical protein